MQLGGIHHVTAITADALANHSFYTKVLGMRLVKKTVNQDDVTAYHLFYADAQGSPGTDLTFFDWPMTKEQRGTNSIVATGLRVETEASMLWWAEHLKEAGIQGTEIIEIDSRPTIEFEDPEGQRLFVTASGGETNFTSWSESSVPPEHQICGLGPVVLSVSDLAPTQSTLTEVMSMKDTREYTNTDGARVRVFEMGTGGAGSELHVAVEVGKPPAKLGSGGVHHVAFRTPNFEEYEAWYERLKKMRVAVSDPIDRFYFKSLYFREPNRILFEIATDGPGFTADERLDSLGVGLALPPFLEARREEIEAGLEHKSLGF